jgi:hypothetical protein
VHITVQVRARTSTMLCTMMTPLRGVNFGCEPQNPCTMVHNGVRRSPLCALFKGSQWFRSEMCGQAWGTYHSVTIVHNGGPMWVNYGGRPLRKSRDLLSPVDDYYINHRDLSTSSSSAVTCTDLKVHNGRPCATCL